MLYLAVLMALSILGPTVAKPNFGHLLPIETLEYAAVNFSLRRLPRAWMA
jgi:hypothetical protein